VIIKETTSGTVTEQRDFVWCGNERCEVRNGLSGDALLRQFFSFGETISGTSYFFTNDHLGSTREMTNSAGSIVWQQSFDPYGVASTVVSATPADFGFAGYYLHSRSGLNLSATRAYSPVLGRFINRDPIGESGGVNLYEYVGNNPMSWTDPLGLQYWPDPQSTDTSGMTSTDHAVHWTGSLDDGDTFPLPPVPLGGPLTGMVPPWIPPDGGGHGPTPRRPPPMPPGRPNHKCKPNPEDCKPDPAAPNWIECVISCYRRCKTADGFVRCAFKKCRTHWTWPNLGFPWPPHNKPPM
jgi:RHS repeat-associated protein